jgi:Flp pilus assembly protein protease CpaA
VIPAIALIALITDLTRSKIYNWLTLPALVAGVAVQSCLGGWGGLAQSGLGVLAGLVLFGWMFWTGAMGGGDVKLLMAIGAWVGPGQTAETALLSIALGGAFALVIMIATGRIVDFSRRLYHSVMTLFVRELEFEMPKLNTRWKMPFGVPLSIASVWNLFGHPLSGWLWR